MPRLLSVLAALIILVASTASTAAPINPNLFNLDAYRGKVVYLDFWASWCGPCKFSFPYMEQLARRFQGQGLVIITDNLDQSSARAAAFLRDVGGAADIPVIYDQNGVLASRYKVSDMPTSILIDRQGKVRYVHRGFYREKEDEYTSHITALLKE